MTILEILFLIVVFISNIVQGITGFAGTVIAMPFSINLVGISVARPILNLVAIVISLLVVIFNFKSINFKKLLLLILFVGVGFGLGYLIHFLKFNGETLLTVYGIIIVIIALIYLFIGVDPNKIPKWIYPIILVLAGIMHFLFVSGGPLVVIFAMSVIKDKNEFRATLSTMWVVLNSIILGTNIIEGSFTPHILLLPGIAVVTSLLSLIIAKLLLKKINTEVFMKIAYILLLISGLVAIF